MRWPKYSGEVSSIRALITSYVASEVEKVTGADQWLTHKELEDLVQYKEVMKMLTSVMFEEDQVLKILAGFMECLENESVDWRVAEELEKMASHR